MPCIIYTTMHHLPGPAPVPQPWRFDTTSAIIGAAVALLLAGLAYHFRDALRLGWETLIAPLTQAHHRLQAGAEDRYRELAITQSRSLIVPAHLASLDDIFVEPTLFSPAPLPQSISEIEPVPASPQTTSLRRMLRGHPQLVILGAPGAGKTTLLAYITLVCARIVNDEKGKEKHTQARAMLGLAMERLPLYVPLSAMDWNVTDGEGRQEGDGIERLLSAAVTAVGGSSGLVRPMRQRLETGQAIVLADNWDELSPQQRQWAAAWLSELIDALPGNLWLVGAGTRGYAPLTEAGFVPLTLASWDARQVETFARQWVAACPSVDEEPPALPELVAKLRHAAREGSSPLELTLRAFVCLSDRQPPIKRGALFARALDLLLWQEKEPEVLTACRAALGQVALNLQQEGRAIASREEIEAAIEAALPPPEERPARAATHVFRALTGERGLLRPAGSHHYAFTHPLWQAYLAARQLVAIDPATLAERLDDLRWSDVLRFYAELGNIKPLVAVQLRKPDDMFHTHLHTLSSWINVAPEEASWRDGAMAVLARSFLQPGQPPQVQQALAEALAATGVPGITYFFKQALQHPDAEVRVAAALGLIRRANELDLAMLEALLEDEDAVVREATVRKLAYLDVDAATRWLKRILLEGDDTLRPVAARALAVRGKEGVASLREAIESEDVMARRAAVFGLAQAEAWDLLEKVAREDEQWIVRSAASAALEEMEKQEKASGVAPPPKIEQLPWLISWAAAQGEGVGLGDTARRMLWRALSEGDAATRLAAAQVLAQVCRPDDVEPLRTALTDSDPVVAGTALDALAEIGRRYATSCSPLHG